jgi:hypothetical protein
VRRCTVDAAAFARSSAIFSRSPPRTSSMRSPSASQRMNAAVTAAYVPSRASFWHGVNSFGRDVARGNLDDHQPRPQRLPARDVFARADDHPARRLGGADIALLPWLRCRPE